MVTARSLLFPASYRSGVPCGCLSRLCLSLRQGGGSVRVMTVGTGLRRLCAVGGCGGAGRRGPGPGVGGGGTAGLRPPALRQREPSCHPSHPPGMEPPIEVPGRTTPSLTTPFSGVDSLRVCRAPVAPCRCALHGSLFCTLHKQVCFFSVTLNACSAARCCRVCLHHMCRVSGSLHTQFTVHMPDTTPISASGGHVQRHSMRSCRCILSHLEEQLASQERSPSARLWFTFAVHLCTLTPARAANCPSC